MADANQPDTRPLCKFGAKCYRKKKEHFEQFRHVATPADGDAAGGKKAAPSKKRAREESPESDHDNDSPAAPAAPSGGGPNKKARTLPPKEDCLLEWERTGTLMVANPARPIPASAHVAAFDLDSTLTDTASGRTFAKGRTDWRLWDPSVPAKLVSLYKEGYKIVIISNQLGLNPKKQKTTPGDVQYKVHRLLEACGEGCLPVQVIMATEEDENRKPAVGMWEYFVKHMNGGMSVDMSASFYCGDAAGRTENWKPGTKKDFSCSDRKFAHNAGLPFKTPEELFLGEAPTSAFTWHGVDPSQVLASNAAHAASYTAGVPQPEMVIMVGMPASGKSSFVRRFFEPEGYVRVNQDTLKTEAKCKKAAEEAAAEGKSVVIDNTNAGREKRALFIAIAKRHNMPVRCFRMTTPKEVCEHNNMFREAVFDVPHVPRIGYAMFNKKFQEPTKAEGFSEVCHVDFVPHFASDDHKARYLKFT